jgi:hypothetical protein
VPKELDSARAGGLALATLSRLLTVLSLVYAGGPGGGDAVRDYRFAVQREVRHRGDKGGGGRCEGSGATRGAAQGALCRTVKIVHRSVVYLSLLVHRGAA